MRVVSAQVPSDTGNRFTPFPRGEANSTSTASLLSDLKRHDEAGRAALTAASMRPRDFKIARNLRTGVLQRRPEARGLRRRPARRRPQPPRDPGRGRRL
jgi:hypothetical protein